ncbi:PcfJ domain-containing protein [Paenibacillus dendritiformis]|uniref:PcfJ-like protein n=1 Tax=Paenibacillus dendritiformis C454 TaxID=1131935 RepID=H3SAC5_9BACL|nr:PcfJ domain-containing protein [Paenibacillus dendritiformis]EHQ63928.1 hypothetical protein PDENDC454_02290 [Paenibacillus dendritiformis C454]CAH8772251.1 PcfJ domain-containing protein [Paenibacillus dendritiformis]
MSKDFAAHLPNQVSDELNTYVVDVALRDSRYIFTRRMGGFQYGYCTHCKKEYLTKGFRHGKTEMCEKCGSFCTVKASGRGRSRLIDDAYLVWYDKSLINPKAVVAHGIYVKRDYTGDYREVNTQFYVQAEYLFIPGDPKAKGKARFGEAHMRRRHPWGNHFYSPSSIITELSNAMRRPPFYLDKENVREAVHGTPFQYSGWEEMLTHRREGEVDYCGLFSYERRAGEPRTDLVKFFALAAKYPCIEYLVKLGLSSLIEAKINGHYTYNAINWRGATMEKVFKLSKQEIREMRTVNTTNIPLMLHSYRFYRKKGINVSFDQANKLRDLTFEENQDSLKSLGISHTVNQAIKYILKQLERPGASKYYSSASSVLRDWRDYLNDCKKLGMDMASQAVCYPNDLHSAHQKTLEKVKYKEDRALNIRIANRLEKLNKLYQFEYNGLVIRPAMTSVELFREGKELSHCVGGYAKNYADGKCDLLFIRRVSEPDKPFYTMEVSGGQVFQCRGYENCSMTPEVRDFVDRFISVKLKKKKPIKVKGVAV